jgi:hypothetical protein
MSCLSWERSLPVVWDGAVFSTWTERVVLLPEIQQRMYPDLPFSSLNLMACPVGNWVGKVCPVVTLIAPGLVGVKIRPLQ